MADRDKSTAPFVQPWKIVERGEAFVVEDAVGRTLSFTYFEDDPNRREFTKRLSKYDARRMAEQILRLPDLVRIEREARNRE
jgi:hypothetical protein